MIATNNIPEPRTPAPKYKNTVVCTNCHAEFRPGNWCRGITFGTSDRLYNIQKIDDKKCPVCFKPFKNK